MVKPPSKLHTKPSVAGSNHAHEVNEAGEVSKTGGSGVTNAADEVSAQNFGGGLSKTVTAKPGELAKKLLAEPGNFHNLKVFTQYSTQGSKVIFKTDAGYEAQRVNGNASQHGGKPQQIMFEIPASHLGLRLAHVELTHSQQSSDKTSSWSGKKSDNDTTAGYIQVEFHVEGQGWSSLGQAKKFAELRQEVERLHDLPTAGKKIDAIRLRNVGIDPVRVHKLTLHYLPAEKPAHFDQEIMTPGTSFGDPWSSISPSVHRDKAQNVKGNTRYPGAVILNNSDDWADTPKATLDKLKARNWSVSHNGITIPLEAGKRLRIAEVAIGDTHPDNKLNNDNSYGYKGYATLDIGIRHADGKFTQLTSGENVPPQGVLMGGCDHKVKAGDQLEIRVNADTAGVMGVRLGYDNH